MALSNFISNTYQVYIQETNQQSEQQHEHQITNPNKLSQWIISSIIQNKLDNDMLNYIFTIYSNSIYHVNLFNQIYPCLYIPQNKPQYLHIVLYTLLFTHELDNSD